MDEMCYCVGNNEQLVSSVPNFFGLFLKEEGIIHVVVNATFLMFEI